MISGNSRIVECLPLELSMRSTIKISRLMKEQSTFYMLIGLELWRKVAC